MQWIAITRGQNANALNALGDHSRALKGQLIFDFNVWVEELYGRFSLQWGILCLFRSPNMMKYQQACL